MAMEEALHALSAALETEKGQIDKNAQLFDASDKYA